VGSSDIVEGEVEVASGAVVRLAIDCAGIVAPVALCGVDTVSAGAGRSVETKVSSWAAKGLFAESQPWDGSRFAAGTASAAVDRDASTHLEDSLHIAVVALRVVFVQAHHIHFAGGPFARCSTPPGSHCHWEHWDWHNCRSAGYYN
jgi:hypothetical protein